MKTAGYKDKSFCIKMTNIITCRQTACGKEIIVRNTCMVVYIDKEK